MTLVMGSRRASSGAWWGRQGSVSVAAGSRGWRESESLREDPVATPAQGTTQG